LECEDIYLSELEWSLQRCFLKFSRNVLGQIVCNLR